MKLRLFLLLSILTCALVHAQNITGIWRGYFNSGYGYFKQQYKYEVQINQLSNTAFQKGIQGVTYSYHSTIFYGKATLQGIYDSKNKSITIKEINLVELKISDKSEPCLMTCYLDYRKEGTLQILEGTFTSINARTKADCGSGYVYLEKVKESEFEKEDFLVKKQKSGKDTAAKAKPTVTNSTKTQPPATQQKKTNPPLVKKSTPTTTTQQKKTTTTTQQKKTTPPVAKKSTPKTTTPPRSSQTNKTTGHDTIAKSKPPAILPDNPSTEKELNKKIVPVPKVIKERENALVKTITTNSPEINIQLYDNGEIDGDTITVYHNNEVIAYRQGLTGKPIALNIKSDLYTTHHEFVMVANNLGSIPPNTALMIITTGGKRYELFISSDEKKNAKVVIDYKMPSKESK